MRSICGGAMVGDRDHQEDDFTFVLADARRPDSTVLIVLCDGMGGHVGGEVAAQTAVRAFQDRFESFTSTDPQKRLMSSLEAANRVIGERIRANPGLEGMGCTLIGAIKLADRLIWVSVGDSHIYLFRNETLTKLNADHSLFSELMIKVNRGEITLQEAQANPRRNALISAVMGREIAQIDYNHAALREGDLLIFASDGLDTLPTERLRQQISAVYGREPEEVTHALLDAVRLCRKPRQDNTTIVACYHTLQQVPFWREMTRWPLAMASRWRLSGAQRVAIGGGVVALLVIAGVLLAGLRDTPPPTKTVPAETTPAKPPAEIALPDPASEPLPQSPDQSSASAPSDGSGAQGAAPSEAGIIGSVVPDQMSSTADASKAEAAASNAVGPETAVPQVAEPQGAVSATVPGPTQRPRAKPGTPPPGTPLGAPSPDPIAITPPPATPTAPLPDPATEAQK
ncbi:PP2C family protein-serine/threonine phosphatase [Rhodobacter maris]|uniref:Serine/threonine protein phosphatase PrpC n=1 Tax=Rhodobacter maris TaxID=446682 RepID=A0A285TH31_9RHOB|nr:protein phosphatase 2C domain-containing protein [Rhodobacter maris]SOC21393.1 serine/threonine protein phosphatase PrpC [Rhodobacter maris]